MSERSERASRSEADWSSLIGEMTARGLSVPEASREFGVSKQSLYYWRKKLGDEDQQQVSAFIELPFNPPTSSSSIEIHCRGGTKIICPHLSIAELAGLVRELEGGR